MTGFYVIAGMAACFVCFVVGFNMGCAFNKRGRQAQLDWLERVRRKNNVVPIRQKQIDEP
jgi:hypothetical protein